MAPTGAGKSLIYERFLAQNVSRAVLISPLVALARQQAAQLRRQGLRVWCPSADGSIGDGGGAPYGEGYPGESEVWILSPERLLHPPTLQKVGGFRPNLWVVDECHCIWEWGEKFRPAFTIIPEWVERFKAPRSLWLTATLPSAARRQLAEQLPHPQTWLGEFDLPPGLQIESRQIEPHQRVSVLLEWTQRRPGKGIVFVHTRIEAARWTRLLRARGQNAMAYHAGLSREERANLEGLLRQGGIEVVVATSAFGMGVHYPDIQWVVLTYAPSSVLAMTQAIGRAGRTVGGSAHALVIWSGSDFQQLEWMIQGSERKRVALAEIQTLLATHVDLQTNLSAHFKS